MPEREYGWQIRPGPFKVTSRAEELLHMGVYLIRHRLHLGYYP